MRSIRVDSSTWILLASNVFTIALAVFEQLSFGTVIWIYWMQSVVIGLFNAIRIFSLDKFSTEGMTSNGQPVAPNSVASKIQTGIFFLVHYGLFHLVYAFFLFASFPDVHLWYVGVGAAIFFSNHLFSFIEHWKADRTRTPNLGSIMFRPYLRIIPMHLTIVLFGMVMQSARTLIIFLLLKTVADVTMHMLEHKKDSTSYVQP